MVKTLLTFLFKQCRDFFNALVGNGVMVFYLLICYTTKNLSYYLSENFHRVWKTVTIKARTNIVTPHISYTNTS